MTPKRLLDKEQSSGYPIFERANALDHITQSCKQIAAADENLFNCALSVTIPINEEAKRLAR